MALLFGKEVLRLSRGGGVHWSSPLFAAIVGEIESEDAFVIGGAFKHFRMAQRANRVHSNRNRAWS
jgi:hypothetical protein